MSVDFRENEGVAQPLPSVPVPLSIHPYIWKELLFNSQRRQRTGEDSCGPSLDRRWCSSRVASCMLHSRQTASKTLDSPRSSAPGFISTILKLSCKQSFPPWLLGEGNVSEVLLEVAMCGSQRKSEKC